MLNRTFALAALLALAATAPAAAQDASPDREEERSISVTGEGSVFADNDIARFSVGVTTRRRTAGEALRSNSFTLRRVRGALRGAGIEPKDLETQVISLSRTRRKKRTFYVARNSISVIVRNLDNAGEVLDAAVRAGATNVFGPSFGLADPQAIYRDALGLAFVDARAKAERLAREAGLTLGPALRISESGFEEPSFDESAARQEAGAPAPSTPPVSRGRTRIEASVAVTFATS